MSLPRGVCAGSSTFLSAGSWSAAHAPLNPAERRSSHDLRGSAEESQVDGPTLYERGVPSDLFTLILQGKALIYTGDHIADTQPPQQYFVPGLVYRYLASFG